MKKPRHIHDMKFDPENLNIFKCTSCAFRCTRAVVKTVRASPNLHRLVKVGTPQSKEIYNG